MSGQGYFQLLKSGRFLSFLSALFLGALNDNVYKIIVSLIAVDIGMKAEAGGVYLSLAGAVFILPYLLFSGYAAHIADAFSKRRVLIATKSLEIAAMALALAAFMSGRVEVMLVVLFLMALQSTLFSPAKYGILPEVFRTRDLSRANGLVELCTFLAIILGTSFGAVMFGAWSAQPAWMGSVMIAIAVAGTLMSLGVWRVAPPSAKPRFHANPWAEISRGLKRVMPDKPLRLTVLGLSYFWFLAVLLQLDIILFGKNVMGLDDTSVGLLTAFLGLGIALGSIAAGRLSGNKVELGLVPLGAMGIVIALLVLSGTADSFAAAAAALAGLGFAGGLFIVPMNAFLQHRAGANEKGRIIATNNFLNAAGMLLASGTLWLLHDRVGVDPVAIILLSAAATAVGTVYALKTVPEFLIRFLAWMLTHSIYRLRVEGVENVPERGPALLVCNHISYVDAILVAACVQRFIRFLMYRGFYELPVLKQLMRLMKAIPISEGDPKGIRRALTQARAELQAGHVVCIFPEGAISRTGSMLAFKRGFERIVAGLDVPVIPVHLDGLWGSVFSFKGGRFLLKRPQRLRYPVTVSFGEPLATPVSAWQARQAVLELGSEAFHHRHQRHDLLHTRVLGLAKRRWFRLCAADSTGRKLSYGRMSAASLALAGWTRRRHAGESMIGVLLPASVGAALTNIALMIAGKVPVNLNFTVGREALDSAMMQAGVETVITSRKFIDRIKLDDLPGVVFLEDVMRDITPIRKFTAALAALLLPAGLIRLLFGGGGTDRHAPATVIFSSGSTGTPKGVVLSHHNILSNVVGSAQILQPTGRDRMLGVLPFFHCFGFTGTLWLPLLTGMGVVYHPNPMEGRIIGKTVANYGITIMASTPTFIQTYIKVCPPETFASLRYAIVGAEKLRQSIADAFQAKYGIDLLEGYGCTELGAVVAVNAPDVRQKRLHQVGRRSGTVGHPIPGIALKVVDRDTGEPLPPDEEGLLLVKSPARMTGYLNEPEKTEAVLRDGWYVTGDIATLDQDGFLTVTDRLSRFSKIGGEMVPHIKVEEVIDSVLGEHASLVTAIPDDVRGERLVAFYAHHDFTPRELWERLSQTDLPKLWLPKPDNLYAVDSLPLLGSGKADLGRARRMALARTKPDQPSNTGQTQADR
jgi:acyl-[acyl-carrier-protein]-phospholipid O-acyltransferase/long-chain-fatty-acid--[acyl-carrier-protein] ligase